MDSSTWRRLEGSLEQRSTIVVLRARLSGLAPATELLAPDEIARAERLVLPARRRDYVAGRAFLRRRLGEFLGRDPAGLVFSYGPLGKPGLVDADLAFNLSHSGDLVVLAQAQDGALGVDVECARSERDLAALATRFFRPEERAALAADPGRLVRSFHEIWTRKEAILKVTGSGVFAGLQSFAVSCGPDPRVLVFPEDGSFPEGIELLELPLGEAAAALARIGAPREIELLDDPSW